MKNAFRTLALSLCLAVAPGCAALRAVNPITAEASAEQKAYALIGAYALALDEAATLVRNPATPKRMRDALAGAERVATPAAELVKGAAIAYRRSRTASNAAALARALDDAQGPIAALSRLLNK